MSCVECSGSGACDVCDGYGCTPDSYPNAGDGVECEACTGSGICPECLGENDQHEQTAIEKPTERV
jgi:hypothetical protein